MLDGFDYHDRVVNHDPDRQDETEHARHVDRESQKGEQSERTDNGDRNRKERNQRGAPALQKHEHDEDNQRNRYEKRRDHVGDRGADELRGIVRNAILDAGGKGLFGVFEKRADAVRGLHGVGARRKVRDQD